MKMNTSKSKTMLMAGCSMSALALMTAVPGVAYAQIEEIIVTSTKRAENVMDVPLSLTAYDANFMKEMSIRNSKDLIKFTPGFAGDTKDSFLEFVNVRGISTNDYGNGGDPSVGMFKNGLYQGRTGSAVSNMFDMERAEVLRGPQNFLFGRNAIAGAISFYTKKPDFDGGLSGYIDVGVGDRNLTEVEAAVNLPITDNFAVRIAGTKASEDGYVTNTFDPTADKLNGYDNGAARITAALQRDNWDATFMAEYEDHDGSGGAYRQLTDDGNDVFVTKFGADIMPDADLLTVNLDQPLGNHDRAEIKAFSAEFNFDLGWATLTSMTGFKDHTYSYAEDWDGTAAALGGWTHDQEGDYLEQELRLVSQSDGPVSWYGGVSFFEENIDTTVRARGDADTVCAYYYYWAAPDAGTCAEVYAVAYDNGSSIVHYGTSAPLTGWHDEDVRTVGKYSGYAAYFDMKFEVGEQVDLGFGLRYAHNEKDFSIQVFEPVGPWAWGFYNYGFYTDGFVSGTESWSGLTPRIIARYRPNDDTMIYGSITNGWKSGGFNAYGVIGAPSWDVAPADATPAPYKEEEVWSYEVGIKGDTASNRIRYDVAAYTYTYTDLQLQYWASPGLKNTNIGEATAYGVEGSMQAVLGDHFNLILSGSFNSNEFTGAEALFPGTDGNTLQMTPERKVSAVLRYHTPVGETGKFNASFDFVNQTERYIGLENLEANKLGGWTDASVRMGYEDDTGWSINAYVENVFDEQYFDAGYGGTPGAMGSYHYGISRPRTAGIRFHMDFGQ